MVNKERIRLLVDALRSGEYQQGTGALQKQGKFCCLGVACEVAMKNGLAIATDFSDDDGDGVAYIDASGDPVTGELPFYASEWYGLGYSDPRLIVPFEHEFTGTHYAPGASHGATTLNDSARLNFAQIADCFEYTYLREEGEHGQQGTSPTIC